MHTAFRNLGWVSVQHDISDILSELTHGKAVSESLWISCYNKDKGNSIHETVKLEAQSTDKELSLQVKGQKEIAIQLHPSKLMIEITCNALDIPKIVCYGPSNTHNLLQPSFTQLKKLSAIDISPGASLFVVGGDTSASSLPQLQVGYMNPFGKQRATLEGHKATVNTLQFFPSGQVVLSGASDFQLRIWSALDGSNPVTLTGHKGGITSTAIIAKGKNVLSASRDGSVRLWHCGEAREIATLVQYPDPVNHITVAYDISSNNTSDTSHSPIDSGEVETHNKIVVCAVDSGLLCGIQLATRTKIFELTIPEHKETPMTTGTMSGEWLMGGNSEGWLALFHVPTQQCKLVFRRNQAAISNISVQMAKEDSHQALDMYRWWITTVDGQCYCIQLIEPSTEDTEISVNIIHELVGADMEAIVHLQRANIIHNKSNEDYSNTNKDSQKIYTVTTDGILREYHIPLL
ncbi:WD40-repeat-containing domain protein [Syncephalis fuscata]|nr:WD40-repeat-containing domain protein [Syncephalis fuscata]